MLIFFACTVFQTDLSRRVSIVTLILVHGYCYYDLTTKASDYQGADKKGKKRTQQ